MEKKRVVIIGAGITGLTCAYQLAQKGYDVRVLEKNERVGGLARTIEFEQCRSDLGPHQFCTDNPQLVKILEDVLGPKMLKRTKKVAQFFQGQFVNYPLKPTDFMLNLNPWLVLKVGFEVLGARIGSLFSQKEDYTFKNWVERRFGPTMYKIYFGPYTQKVWGIDPEQLDPRTASSRIAFSSVFDLIVKTIRFFVFKKGDYEHSHSPLKGQFYYAKGGIETLLSELGEKCQEMGVRILTNTQIEEVEHDEQRITALQFADGQRCDDFDLVVGTLPITVMMKLLKSESHHLPIQFRSMIVVLLKVARKVDNPYSWIYYPDPQVVFQRITDYAHFDQGMVAEDSSCICAEISCFEQDEIWAQTDEHIVDRVKQGLVQSGFLKEDDQLQALVHRERFVYPIQVNGFIEMVSGVLDDFAKYQNLVMTGRQGVYKYCDMNECMEMAIDTAEQIDQGQWFYDLSCKFKGVGVK